MWREVRGADVGLDHQPRRDRDEHRYGVAGRAVEQRAAQYRQKYQAENAGFAPAEARALVQKRHELKMLVYSA